jgi:hypothetical protein
MLKIGHVWKCGHNGIYFNDIFHIFWVPSGSFYALLLCCMYVGVLSEVPQFACSSVTTSDLICSGFDSQFVDFM